MMPSRAELEEQGMQDLVCVYVCVCVMCGAMLAICLKSFKV